MPTSPVVIGSKPGVKRDGTDFEGDYYVDAKWCRFQRGLPRKMGGYRLISSSLNGAPRELEIYSSGGFSYVVSGHRGGIDQFTVDKAFNVGIIYDRTPVGFVANDLYDWQFAEIYDTAANALKLLAVATLSLQDIDSSNTSQIYVGDAYDGTVVLAPVATPPTDLPSGGIMALQSYAIAYGSNGLVEWCVSNTPSNWTALGSGEARVTEQKIVKGLPLRGTVASALLWSLSALIRMDFTGGTAIWSFTTLSSETSILSPNTVVEYDGTYYWAGVDRFLSYNGILQEVPNDLNLNFFFDNMNYNYRGKAFAFKVPRYGEIWFCAPLFGATECNYAVIYNVAESRRAGFPVWYDTILPEDFRSAAHYAQIVRLPMISSPTVSGGKYSLWAHEFGTDKVSGLSSLAIESYFETADINLLVGDKPQDKAIHIECLEPDFVQSGDMSVQVRGSANVRAPVIDSDLFTFADSAVNSEDQLVYLREQRRIMRLKFLSNVAGGDYQMGQCIAHIGPADGRRLG